MWDRQDYVGPYFVTTARVVVEEGCSCSREDCPLRTDATHKWCPECGRKRESVFQPRTRCEPFSFDVREKMGEALHNVEWTHNLGWPQTDGEGGPIMLCAWVPNVRRNGRPERLWDKADEKMVAIEPQMIEDEKEWLQQAFCVEMLTLIECYGQENFKTSWGWLAWVW